MSKDKVRLAHAVHNENACKHLDKKPEFLDWVVTTAFYSALNFAKYKLFPRTETTKLGPIEYLTFEAYYDFLISGKSGKNEYIPDKHTALSDLVKEDNEIIGNKYHQLLNLCKTARYVHFHFTRKDSNQAKIWLDEIKKWSQDTEMQIIV